MRIRKGNSTPKLALGTSTVVASFSSFQDPEVSWGGDIGYVKTQEGTIDDTTAGTVGRIHLLERVYDQAEASSLDVCITAGDGSGQGLQEVKVYYGSSSAVSISSPTLKNGIQGYWFTLNIDSPASIEERVIYAEIISNDPSFVSRVTSKTIRIGTPTYVNLTPADTIGAGNNINERIQAASIDTVFILSDGLYYVTLPGGSSTAAWVEVRGSGKTSLKCVNNTQAIPGSSYTFVRKDRMIFRAKHMVLRNLELNQHEATTYTIGDYIGCDSVRFTDPLSFNEPAARPGRAVPFDDPTSASEVNWYDQRLFKRESNLNAPAELHNCDIRSLVVGGGSEYFNVSSAAPFDVLYTENPMQNLVVNRLVQQSPYSNNSPDLETLRYYQSALGPRNGSYNASGKYTYDNDSIQDISLMTYGITGIDTTSSDQEYVITLAETPTIYPPRFTPGIGYQGNQLFFDFSFFRWANGDALERNNRKLVEKGVSNTNICISWITSDDASGTLTNQIRVVRANGDNLDSNDLAMFNSWGFGVGDRIAVLAWAHADWFQTPGGSAATIDGALIQDSAVVFEQQMLFQNSGYVRDFIIENSLFIDPRGIETEFAFQIQQPTPVRMFIQNSSISDNDIFTRTASLTAASTNITLRNTILRDLIGDASNTDSWTGVEMDTCWYQAIANITGVSVTNSSTWADPDVDAYGVMQSNKATSLYQLPYGINGAARSLGTTIGAVSASGVSYVPRARDYFVVFPSGEWCPTQGSTVSVVNGEIESANAPIPSYQWMTNTGPISGATSSSYDTTALSVGDRLQCSVTQGEATTVVDFGILI